MKIAHITQYFHPEMGYQENNLSIIERKNGHEVSVFCINNLDKWTVKKSEIAVLDKQFISIHNIHIIRLGYYFSLSTRYFQSGLNKALNSYNPDLLFIHGVALPLSLAAMKWAAKNGKRTIVDDHMVKAGTKNKYSSQFYFFFKPAFKLFLKINRIKVNKWIAVSAETKEFMQNNYGIKEDIRIIPLGYNDDHVFFDKEGSEKWMLKNGLSSKIKYVLYIGKINFNKNPMFILEPFRILKKEFPDYTLLLIGNIDKQYNSLLRTKINELDLTESVIMLNPISNYEIRYVFSSVEMVIWPFGSSMAMLEAMACKCPVIASNMPVNQERLSSGRGVLFENSNIEDLVEKMHYTVRNRKQVTEKAIDWVVQYSWKSLEKIIMDDMQNLN